MAAADDIVRFKTNAWQNPGSVASYAERVRDTIGVNRLKNHIELAHIHANITGTRVVDVGIGTGRASLPLLRAGFHVTGVDASQAMLDRCRADADGLPIELHLGDLTKLPLKSESFDSAIALNVMSHFPTWRDALADWARVVRPQGRIVFDVHSSDHLSAVAVAKGCDPVDLLTRGERENPEHYFLRIGVDELAAAAHDFNLTLVALIPYGAIYGGSNLNYWLQDSLLWGELGDRALSWLTVDAQLYSFGLFIEQLVSHLSTHSTPRFMAVFEKGRDQRRTELVVDHHRRLAGLFASGEPTLPALRAIVGSDADAWGATLNAHLEYSMNETLLAMMLASPSALVLRILIRQLAGDQMADRLYEANRRQRIDGAVHGFVQRWFKDLTDPELFRFRGVNLGPSLEYDLMHDILMLEMFDGGGPG